MGVNVDCVKLAAMRALTPNANSPNRVSNSRVNALASAFECYD